MRRGSTDAMSVVTLPASTPADVAGPDIAVRGLIGTILAQVYEQLVLTLGSDGAIILIIDAVLAFIAWILSFRVMSWIPILCHAGDCYLYSIYSRVAGGAKTVGKYVELKPLVSPSVSCDTAVNVSCKVLASKGDFIATEDMRDFRTELRQALTQANKADGGIRDYLSAIQVPLPTNELAEASRAGIAAVNKNIAAVNRGITGGNVRLPIFVRKICGGVALLIYALIILGAALIRKILHYISLQGKITDFLTSVMQRSNERFHATHAALYGPPASQAEDVLTTYTNRIPGFAYLASTLGVKISTA